MASQPKKPRTDSKAKSFYAKQARKSSKNSIEVGDKGFLVTCNFREKDSVREVYRLLNEYYTKLHEEDEPKKEETVPEDDDIESQLKSEIEKTSRETKEKAQKFQSTDTGVQNLIFIKTSIEDPLALGTAIIRDLAETKIKKTKVTLRMLPIEAVCKAKIEDIKNAAGLLFDKHFLKEPSTFAINFNKRFNNDLQRDEVIKELADLVSMKNIGNKVNLKNPEVRP
jgi:tRNA acetyltransferase TAN1